jgi:4-carboxymuconolactone decarboxylase
MPVAAKDQAGQQDSTFEHPLQHRRMLLMITTENALGGRLPLSQPADLSPEQHRLFDHITATVVPWAQRGGFAATDADGRLIGPFNPSLLNPSIATALLALQAAEEKHTSLHPRVREIVILTVGAVWRAPYELYAHSAAASRVGLPPSVVATLAAGGTPDGLSEAEQIAHRFARALTADHRVDDDLYGQVEKIHGATGVFEITVLAGIYHAVCGILNVFTIPAP